MLTKRAMGVKNVMMAGRNALQGAAARGTMGLE